MLVHAPAHVPSPFVTVQSASLVQKTVFTHSDGSELGDCDGYEQTSMRVDPEGRSAVFTQHVAWVSLVRQLVPLHLFDLRVAGVANGSVVLDPSVQLLVAFAFKAAPVQLNALVLPHV